MTFTAGVTTQTITVPITNDLIDEGVETFSIELSGRRRPEDHDAGLVDRCGLGKFYGLKIAVLKNVSLGLEFETLHRLGLQAGLQEQQGDQG